MQPSPLVPSSILCSDPYHFAYYDSNNPVWIDVDFAWTLYCMSGGGTLENGLNSAILNGPQIAHGTGAGTFTPSEHSRVFVVANLGHSQAVPFLDVPTTTKIVSKPWGEELWLSRERKDYCLKRIHINAGHQTSLQFHREKFETNVLIEGEAQLIGADGYSEHLAAPCYVNIAPLTVHRLRALTDIVLVEASTAHLDDVVRLQDDSGRGNGRIESEHQ